MRGLECLLPHYDVDPAGGAAGGSAGTAGTTGSAGAAGNISSGAGASGAGASGAGGSAGAPMGQAGGTVMLTCDSNSKVCDGKCVAIDNVDFGCTPTSCNKASCPVAGTGTLACQAGACVIGSCAAGTKKCGDQCVAIGDPTYGCGMTGCDATSCPAPGVGTLICNNGACVVGTCGAGTKKCGSNCVPLDRNNGCGDTANCSSCAASETCVASGAGVTKCACVPDNVEACRGAACGSVVNNCGATVQCADTCASPNTCGGGSAGANGCGCTPDDPCAVLDCGSATDSCKNLVQCANKCPASLPICTGNTCHQCATAADCPAVTGNPCAKAACNAGTCGFATVAANTNCAGGGKCSATAPGICVRSAVNAGDFKIDATEVTRGEYELFLAAKAGSTAGQAPVCSFNVNYTPYDPSTPAISDYDKPVRVDWCDASAYCAWAGGRMCGKRGGGSLGFDDFSSPALSQWMRACSGTLATTYPYGNAFVQGACNGATAAGTESPTANVATFPGCNGGFAGLYDMSGNVEEWDDSCNGTTGAADSCRIRGGSTYPSSPFDPTYSLRCDSLDSNMRTGNAGVRCCYD